MALQALEELAAPDFAAATSSEGQAWLAALPSLFNDLARRWSLTVTDEAPRSFPLLQSTARDGERSLVHTDLHYDNVLASGRPDQPWLVIDPKAAAGTPARSAAELLWTRVVELPSPEAITSLLDTNVETGQTIDPVRCQRVASALAPIVGLSRSASRQSLCT
jgi:streptomycin 6-kinase